MHFFTRDRTFYREYFYLLFFIALQNMITFGVNLADNIMLGVYSESALSGVALANQIQFFLQMLVGGISEGIVVLSAQYWGRRETKPIKQIIA
ncbi:MAG: MATE family efflux transporter, partial [Clostridia bacterium]